MLSIPISVEFTNKGSQRLPAWPSVKISQ